tara:strand:+ start:161 stop:589 length:429 start_codon:yes stop_codon:yes gene_type:complete
MLKEKEKKVIKYNKYQQGDVVMFQVDDETFERFSTQNGVNDKSVIDYNTQSHNNPILAFGEVTGHLHQIHMKDMLEEAEVTLHMGRFREAGKDVPEAFEVREKTVTLTHEEHNPLDVPPGKYVVRIVREFDHIAGRSRYVAD